MKKQKGIVSIRLPYSDFDRLSFGYVQELFEDQFELEEENEALKHIGMRNIQDDLNQFKDTNSIYEVIDKFQNTNKLMADAAEAFEFMKRTGRTPADMNDSEIHNVADLPKSLQELIRAGQTLNEVINEVNNQNSTFDFESNKAFVEQTQNQQNNQTFKQNQQETQQNQEVTGANNYEK